MISGVKIQLEYDLLSGQFLHVEVGPGKQNDVNYVKEIQDTADLQDLCIQDLGCFSLIDLDAIQPNSAYYLSLLKMNTKIQKNVVLKKQSQFTIIDLDRIIFSTAN